MQQCPAGSSPPARARAPRAALAGAAALVAIASAALDGAVPNDGAAPRATGVATGSLAAYFAPALPHRAHPAAHARPDSEPDAPALRALTPRQRLAFGARGTYIGEVLRARDSSVVRWPDRVERPLTVWVANAPGLPDWRPAYVARVADAFAAWESTGVPVRFRFVQDSSAAEVHVGWTDRFGEPISGRTVWTRDQHWWMTDANITLALHHSDGNPLDEEQVRAIALHEVGHLLGLDHTTDQTSVMAARVRVRELSAADHATARLVYALPPGRM